MNIPVIVAPYEDELLYGWQLRMAGYNGIKGVHQFQNMFFRTVGGKILSGEGTRLDYIFNTDEVCRRYSEQKEFPDPRKILKQMTVFHPMAMFRTYGYQAMQSQAILRGDSESIYHVSMDSMVPGLRLCPQCMGEDRERWGETYYHVWHHFPGVTSCAKHGTELIPIAHDGREWLWLISEKQFLGDKGYPEIHDSKSSRFMKDFYEEPVWIDLRGLQALFVDRMEKLGYPIERPYGRLADDMRCSVWHKEEREKIEERIKRLLQGTWINSGYAMEFTVELFGTYQAFKKAALSLHKELEDDFRILIKNDFSMISDFDIITKLQCRKCGHEFWIHPYAIALGCGCPTCDKKMNSESLINRQLSHIGDGQYELAEPFRGYGKHTKILHRTCGKVRYMRLSDAVWMERECGCMYEADLAQNQKMIDEKAEGFQVIRYLSGRKFEGQVYIRHVECGREFRIHLNNFLKFPYCRCCRTFSYSTEKFIQEMKELTGDEYEVLSPFVNQKTKIKVRHRICGTITAALPSAFLNGRRCDLCTAPVTCQEVAQAVSECTAGTYKISDIKKNVFTVEGPDGEICRKSAGYIMQELSRPTHSNIFQKRMKKPELKVRKAAVIYMRASSACSMKGFFGYEDSDMSRDETKNAITWLVKNGYLERIGEGRYRVTGQ